MVNPYPGPRPFRAEESAIFAGRDQEIAELTSLIVAHQAVLLYAQSGAGKSSLVSAGLAASLSQRNIDVLPVGRVGVPVPAEVPVSDVTNVFTFSLGCDLLPDLPLTDPWRRTATLTELFDRIPKTPDETGSRRLTVCAIDQFEELFSVYPERWADRETFFLEMSALLEARRDVRVLFVLREDSFAAFNNFADLLPERCRTRYYLERLGEDDAIAAVNKPLESTGYAFASGVAASVVRDLMRINVVGGDGTIIATTGQFVEPVQLQVVCYTLFEHLPAGTTLITEDIYHQFGDPDAALEDFYDQAVKTAVQSTGQEEGELRRWFSQQLITPAGTRGLIFQGGESTGGMRNAVVAVLEQRHIIRPEIRSGSRWYELTHDRFIHPIQRSNLNWQASRSSSSFDYAGAIDEAAARAGYPAREVHRFIDSLSDEKGASRPQPGGEIPELVLSKLIEIGLLRRDVRAGQAVYSLRVLAPATTTLQRENRALDRRSRAYPTEGELGATPLRVSVLNGDLITVAGALLVGHYLSAKLTGAEAVASSELGGAMAAALARGVYPGPVGTHQIFVNTVRRLDNPWRLPHPSAVIVVGLGPEGHLHAADMMMSVRQAVIAWAQRLTESSSPPRAFSLATTLMGSGGIGVSVAEALQWIVKGAREANERLTAAQWPTLEQLQIVELFLDRATEAWRAAKMLAAHSPAFYTVEPIIQNGPGGLPKSLSEGYRGVDYDFMTALTETQVAGTSRVVYTFATSRARGEVRGLASATVLVRELISGASGSPSSDAEIGRTLFALLVPTSLEPYLDSSTTLLLELDAGTAGIPWELLDNQVPGSDDRPWAIRTRLLRKLRDGFPPHSQDPSTAEDILVIGDPAADRTWYGHLPGARREAAAVVNALVHQGGVRPSAIDAYISGEEEGAEPDARTIIGALMARPWRVIHMAGHGELDPQRGAGLVLSNDAHIGPADLMAMRVVPELVFVSCGHLAGVRVSPETAINRVQFAASLAESLLRIGVRCVVVAGWVVDDAAAEAFARAFYVALVGGSRFLDAVAAARNEAYGFGGNTWGAYQCYGDADWRYRREAPGDSARVVSPAEEFSGIASASTLISALETLAVRSQFQNAAVTDQSTRLDYLETAFARLWADNGEVSEAFGSAWAKTGNLERAISWYERATAAEDGRCAIAAIEQLANLRVRLAAASARPDAAIADARREIQQAMELLDALLRIGPTVTRESLYGSAYKRLALIERSADRREAEKAALRGMSEHYRAAERLARAGGSDSPGRNAEVCFSILNRIAAEMALTAGSKTAKPVDQRTREAVTSGLATLPADFWSVVGQTELRLYQSIGSGRLSKDFSELVEEFETHFRQVGVPRYWASVYDNARFVLSPYMSRAAAREAAAAQRLIDKLALLAGAAPASRQHAPPTVKRRVPLAARKKGERRRRITRKG